MVRNAFVGLNTGAFFLLGTRIVAFFPVSQPHQDIFRFALAGFLLLAAMAYLHARGEDPIYNIFLVKAVGFLTLGLATRYGGSGLSLSLAVEAGILLWAARFSGLIMTRLLALRVAMLACGQGLFAALTAGPVADLRLHCIQGAMIVASFLVCSLLYQRTNWLLAAPKSLPFPESILEILWQLDMVQEPPAQIAPLARSSVGLLIPYVYALAGSALYLAYMKGFLVPGQPFLGVCVFSAVLMVAALLLRSKPYGLASMVLATLAALPIGLFALLMQHDVAWHTCVTGLAALGIVAFASEAAYMGRREGLLFHQMTLSPYALYGITSFLTGVYLVVRFQSVEVTLALMAAGGVAALASLILHRRAFMIISAAFVTWAALHYASIIIPASAMPSDYIRRVGWLMLAAPLILDRYYHLRKPIPALSAGLGAYFQALSCAITLFYLKTIIPPEWLPLAVGIAAFGYVAYGFIFRPAITPLLGLLCAMLASRSCIYTSFRANSADQNVMFGFLLLILFWLSVERLLAYKKDVLLPEDNPISKGAEKQVPALGALFLAFSCVMVFFFVLTEVPKEWFSAAMGLAAFAYVAYRLVFTNAAAAPVLGVLCGLLGSVPLVINALRTEEAVGNGAMAGFVLLMIFWLATERLLAYRKGCLLLDGIPLSGDVAASGVALGAGVLTVSCIVLVSCLFAVVPPAWFPCAIGLAAFAYVAYQLVLADAFVAPLLGIACGLIASARIVSLSLHRLSLSNAPAIAGVVLLVAFWFVLERLLRRRASAMVPEAILPIPHREALQRQLGVMSLALSWAVLLIVLRGQIPREWLPFATGLTSFAYLGYGLIVVTADAAVLALTGALLASIYVVVLASITGALDRGMLSGFGILALFWLITERLANYKKARLIPKIRESVGTDFSADVYLSVPILLESVLMLVMLYHIPSMAEISVTFITIGWFALAVVLFLASLACRQHLYRYAGLGIIVLSLGRVFLIDMKQQDALLRVAAFAIVGIGLLVISYGYFRWQASIRKSHPPAETMETAEACSTEES